MADLVVPALGESITEAVVSIWLKQVGDAVAADEPVAELETDKVTVQLPSPAAGVLVEQKVAVGATVKIGEVVGAVDTSQKAASAPAARPPAAPAPAPSASASASAAASAASSASAGSAASAAAGARTPPSPGASPAASPAASSLTPTSAGPAPGPAPGPPARPFSPAASAAPSPARAGGNGEALDKAALLRLTPSQRVQAREVGAIPHARTASAVAAPAGPSVEDRLAQVDPRDEVVAMSPLRKRVAERLVQAQHEAASLTTFNEVDMTQVMELRARYKDSFEKAHGVKLGFMSFFVKACVAACKAFPGVNAEVIGGHIVYKKHYDFGIAVSAPKGLVVPVLRDADALSFAGVEKGVLALAEKARTGKLALADLSGGTFSITNGGIFGSMMSTPLLNYPQTGILGMHNIVKRAVVVGDEVKVRPMMYVALSYDHRVVDGREAVSFLVAVKERLEAPERMLVEV
ncbi:MAG TPA: 2-oxoglutarate dehydrogenase complex dihydrolipoyllysine-residue succinyltransferase [Kofleriaceae bacterium]|nr:2-oxoglutarate dehydrogenase complex dihydrolipoyllysine-residue succinyltransferase [Kofleriaceae bacterium]